jgi:vacuolar-type H+-ATPase subunit I/STV1
MEQIIAILKALGLEVPEDKKETLIAEMKKVFVTTHELDQKKEKITTLEADKATLTEAQTKLQEQLKDLQASSGDLETYKSKVTELTTTLESEREAVAKKNAEEQLSATVNEFFADKHFVNDITKNAIRSELVAKLQTDAARGHGVSELFDSIVKDEKGEIKPNILIDDTTLELEKNRAKIVGSPIKLQPGQHLSTAELMKLKTQNPDMDITPYLGKIRKE